MKKGDLIIVILLVILGAGLLLINIISDVTSQKQAEDKTSYQVVVEIDGEEILRKNIYQSDESLEREVTFANKREDEERSATLEFLSGKVRVQPMPLEWCPEQICCHVFGSIERHGQAIICMPNLMVVRVESTEGQQELEYDVLTG